MKIWLDVHLPPALGFWLVERFDVEVSTFRDAGWQRASDVDVFERLQSEGMVIMTKDSDFVALVEARGIPPQVIWLTIGNTSNANLRHILGATMAHALALLNRGEPIVEIRDVGAG